MGYVIEEKNGKYKVLLSLMKDGYSLRQIKTYLYTFKRNGISNHEALKILYENFLPKLKEVKVNSRVILKNKDGSISILKPIATYTKDSNSLFPIVTDPICGMRFSASKAFSHIDENGKLYHFCASGCESAFKASVKLTNKERIAQTVHA